MHELSNYAHMMQGKFRIRKIMFFVTSDIVIANTNFLATSHGI